MSSGTVHGITDPLLKDEPIDHTGIHTEEIAFLLHKSIDLSSSFGAIQLEQMKEKVGEKEIPCSICL